MIISSQRYLDELIVNEKLVANDYVVLVSPEFSFDDNNYQVVLDGHHSMAAAKLAGVDPEYVEADEQDCDYLGLIESNPNEFLMMAHLGDDYYSVDTGIDVW